MNIGLYHEKAGSRNVGGIATFVREMAAELAASNEVYLYTEAGEQTSTIAGSDVEVVQIPELEGQPRVTETVSRRTPLGRQQIGKLFAFANSLRTGALEHANRNLDVLYTHQYLDDLLLSRVVDVPVVYEYHGLQSTGAGATAREVLSGTEWLIANSRYTASSVREAFGRTVDGVVPPGVDPDLFSPGAEPAVEAAAPTILFVGRVVEGKGLRDLIDAVAATKAEPRVFVVGTGAVETFRAHARSRGLGDDVRFVGEVPHEELPRYYGACDLFCNPSRYESFGMVNLEAMACGTPVVTTDVGGIPEYATHGESALLVPPRDTHALRDALDELLASPDDRARLGERARERAREFAWSGQADRFESFCRSRVLDG